jgi:hypothetical protein
MVSGHQIFKGSRSVRTEVRGVMTPFQFVAGIVKMGAKVIEAKRFKWAEHLQRKGAE